MQVLAHNMASQFTNRQLKITTGEKAKHTEKLSSGYRINRSADDAAGLSISEKMRWQIRGLDKGKDNISEGISAVQVADGALSEIHDILQRVRELTVQAYNDTNTELDRNAIQSEVDDILDEVDRIVDTTTFNTKPLLKGNPTEWIQITDDHEVERTVYMQAVKDIPSWLSVDPELTTHSGYTQQQDVSGTMLNWDGNDATPKEYYGPAGSYSGNYDYKGAWTDTITDNPSAKIDFSALSTKSPAEALSQALYDLVGSKIAFPCGTCSSQLNSVTFGGRVGALSVEGFEKYDEVTLDVTGNVDLSGPFEYNGKTYAGYFDAVQQVLEEPYACNHDDDPNNDIPGEADATRALAESIAKDLRDKTMNALGRTMQDHFDRVVEGDNAYSLIVYDYRDNKALSTMTAADAKVKTSAKVTYKMKSTMLERGTEALAENPPKIMCGALNTSYIELGWPYVSLNALGLLGYRVDRYDVVETYSDEYRDKLTAWENSAQESTYTDTYTEKVVDQILPGGYKDGEPLPPKITFKTEQRTYTHTVKTYSTPKPVPQDGDVISQREYDPDSLVLVDNAIAMVSDARSGLGAMQNRLEHAYALNAGTSENTQAAESRVRDADMSEEMVEFAKHNILEQAGESLLAQSNRTMEGVLSLLQ